MSLRRIIRAIDLHSRRLFQIYHLTEPQLVLLREVMRQETVPIGELAKRASLSNATVTGIVDRLERRGLVERNRGDRDRRKVLVRGTAAAVPLLAQAPPPLHERFTRAWSGLPEEEQTQILTVLNRVASMMDTENEEVLVKLSDLTPQALGGITERQQLGTQVPSSMDTGVAPAGVKEQDRR